MFSQIYLDRIKLHDPPETSLKFLRKLCRNQLRYIPIESFSNRTETPNFERKQIIRSILAKDRGGEGPQLNYLFFLLLRSLEFQCKLVRKNTKKNCMLIIVTIDSEEFLIDVGQKESPGNPVKISPLVQLATPFYYRVVESTEKYLLQKSTDMNSFKTLYEYSGKSLKPIEFLDDYNNQFLNSRNSELMAFRKTENGSIELTNKEMIVIENANKNSYPILNDEEFESKYFQHFTSIT